MYLTEKNGNRCPTVIAFHLSLILWFFEIFCKKEGERGQKIILEMHVSVTWLSGLWVYIFQCSTCDINSVINSQSSEVIFFNFYFYFFVYQMHTMNEMSLLVMLFCVLLMMLDVSRLSAGPGWNIKQQLWFILSFFKVWSTRCFWWAALGMVFQSRKSLCCKLCGSARKSHVGTTILTVELPWRDVICNPNTRQTW